MTEMPYLYTDLCEIGFLYRFYLLPRVYNVFALVLCIFKVFCLYFDFIKVFSILFLININ